MDVLCIGEVLFDVLEDGREFPGGAPANVAVHATALGAPSALVSRGGHDVRGDRLRRWLADAGSETTNVQVAGGEPTGVVRVESAGGSPRYDIAAPAAWDFIEAAESALAAARAARTVVFGTLAQRHPRTRETLRLLVNEARAAGALAVCDLNLRPPFFDDEIALWSLRHCDALKLSAEELDTVSAMLGARGDAKALFGGLLREFGLRRGILTLGGDGARIEEDGATLEVPAAPAQVADTVGAGDAFCAVAAAALAAGRPLREAAPWCAKVASAVVSQPGATPILPPHLSAAVRDFLGR